MRRPAKEQHSHLFTLRLWLEELGDGAAEWRGEVKHIDSGEEHYFREWAAIGELVRGMLPEDKVVKVER